MTASALNQRPTAAPDDGARQLARLAAASEKTFDDLAWLATQICCAPMALVTLLDGRSHRPKSRVGLSTTEAAGDWPFLPHVPVQRGLVQINDASDDERFAGHPLVRTKGGVRFFAGVPLVNGAGAIVGVFCVMDRVPRQLSREQAYALEALSRQAAGHLESRTTGLETSLLDTDRHEQAVVAREQAAAIMQRRTEGELELRATNLELRRQVAELARREDEMRRSEAQLRVAWDNSNDGIRLTNAEGEMLLVNEAFCRMVGKPREELVGQPFSIIHGAGETAPASRQARRRADARGMELRVEKEMVLWDGRKIWFEISNTMLDLPGPSPLLLSTFRDVTERKRAEEDVRSSEEQFRALFESAPIGVATAAANGRFLRTNPTLRAMLGYSEAELQDIPFAQLTHADDVAQSRRLFVDLVEGRTEHVQFQKRYLRKDGSVIWVELTASAIRDADGRFRQSVTLVKDLTESRRAEEQVRDQARLLDLAHDAIMVRDLEGRILYWNSGAERIYGWKAEEVLGRKAAELLYRDPTAHELAWKQALANGEWSGELRQVTRAGKDVVVSGRGTLVRDADGRPKSVLIINTDITEKKKLEVQLLRAQRMESIGTLAGGIAHDLNNILAPITIAAQVLRMKPLDEETEQMLTRIEASAQRGADVVRQVLTFARGMEGERALLQPRHLVKEIAKIAKETFPRAITVSLRTTEDLWPVLGDATQLHQVLLNLCLNARDAMPAGGHLQLTADNALIDDTSGLMPNAKAGPYILLQVKDNGIGIAPAIMDKIFEPFFTTKEAGRGTGLGLSTALGIVRSHGGFVNVHSEVGHGSIFKIYLPATPNAQAFRAPDEPASLPVGHGELILVVDDEAGIRDVTRKILVKNGYSVLTATDGAEGVALFAQQQGKVNLVLTDIMMPRMEGMALVRAIRKIDPGIKVIVTSGLTNAPGQADRSQELQALNVGDFLPKPFTVEKLLVAIHRQLVGEPGRPR